MKRDPRSIWNRSRKAAQPVDAKTLARVVRLAMDETYDELDDIENDLRDTVAEIRNDKADYGDLRSLERRIENLEDE